MRLLRRTCSAWIICCLYSVTLTETLRRNVHDILTHNRVILTHFDSYSVALLFPRWDSNTLLWPRALPESAFPMPAPPPMRPKPLFRR